MSSHPLPRPRRTPRLVVIALGCALFTAAACDADGPRVYTAQPFDPEAMCLGDYVPIGLVTADELAGSCDPVCLRQDDILYLSTVCRPFPDTVVEETPDDSEECAAALASLEAEAYCE